VGTLREENPERKKTLLVVNSISVYASAHDGRVTKRETSRNSNERDESHSSINPHRRRRSARRSPLGSTILRKNEKKKGGSVFLRHSPLYRPNYEHAGPLRASKHDKKWCKGGGKSDSSSLSPRS